MTRGRVLCSLGGMEGTRQAGKPTRKAERVRFESSLRNRDAVPETEGTPQLKLRGLLLKAQDLAAFDPGLESTA